MIEATRIRITNDMVTSGAIICQVVFFFLSFSTSSHFWLARVHSNAHLYLRCRLNRPGGSCYRSKQTSHFVLSASRCSEVDRPAPCSYSPHFRSSTSNPFSPFTTTLERPRVILSRPERKQFVWHRSNRSTSAQFCTLLLNTTFLSELYHDGATAYPPASDEWSTS